MKYPKINSLWKREDPLGKNPVMVAGNGKLPLLVGQYSLEEFGLIKRWQVQEKIDGTNIRIHFYKEFTNINLSGELKSHVVFHGRTDDASIPPHLLKYLQSHFTIDRLEKTFDTSEEVLLFGEGYGPKIQKGGGNYRKEVGFILFDVLVGRWWLKQEDVQKIAKLLEIPYAPIIGTMTEEEIVAYVKSNPLSLCSHTPQVMEGIIARTDSLLLLRNGDRLIWKLKCKDFQ